MQRLRRMAIGILPLVTAVVSNAQDLPPRQGLAFGVGLGASAGQCDDCGGAAAPGVGVQLRAGAYARPSILVGLELNGYLAGRVAGENYTAAFVHGVLRWYPIAARGLSITAGVGKVTASTFSLFSDRTLNATSFSLGLAYDLPMSQRATFSPYVSLLSSARGTYVEGGTPVAGGAALSVVHIGLGLSRH